MAAHSDALALLKVLIAAAWADSRLSQSELNYLKALAQKFNLNDADWLALEPHLEDPPSEDEVKAFFQDLLSRTATSSGRNEVIRHIASKVSRTPRSSEAYYDILRILIHQWMRQAGPMTSKWIAETAGCTYPTVAAALERLEKYLTRQSDRSVGCIRRRGRVGRKRRS